MDIEGGKGVSGMDLEKENLNFKPLRNLVVQRLGEKKVVSVDPIMEIYQVTRKRGRGFRENGGG